jgi:hypothetical protein
MTNRNIVDFDGLTQVASYPAWKVFKRPVDNEGFTVLYSGEPLALKDGGHVRRYYAYTIDDYFAHEGRALTPERKNQAELNHIESGEKGMYDVWINPINACLTDAPRQQESCIEIAVGMRVKMNGRALEILPAPNGNLIFKEVD